MRTITLSRSPNGLPAFLLVWLGQLVSLLGSGLTEFALGVWVYQRTGSTTQFALTFLFLALPRVLLSPFAGALIDRWDRRWTMLLSDLGAGITTVALAMLFWSDALAIWHIYLFTTLGSLCSTFQRPAYAASITGLVPAEHYGRANGMVQVAQATASLIAPALAGLLLVSSGLGYIFLIDIISFLCAVTTLLIVRFPAMPARDADSADLRSVLRDTREGLRYIVQRPGLLGLLLTFAAASFLGLAAEFLLTPYILAVASPAVLGVIVSATGAGLLMGGLLMSLWGGPRRLVVGILCFEVLVSLGMLLMGASTTPWLLGVMVFGYFMSVALGDGCSQTFWQRKVAPDFQGRVFALRQMITLSTVPLGVLLLAPLAEYVFEPLLAAQGAWAGSVGRIVGVGPGRGIGLIFIIAGVANLVILGIAYAAPRVRLVDDEIPDGGG
jgi:MFS transporter, DHA3 family, macrolide efflux protein